jgi:hypothetical protein
MSLQVAEPSTRSPSRKVVRALCKRDTMRTSPATETDLADAAVALNPYQRVVRRGHWPLGNPPAAADDKVQDRSIVERALQSVPSSGLRGVTVQLRPVGAGSVSRSEPWPPCKAPRQAKVPPKTARQQRSPARRLRPLVSPPRQPSADEPAGGDTRFSPASPTFCRSACVGPNAQNFSGRGYIELCPTSTTR